MLLNKPVSQNLKTFIELYRTKVAFQKIFNKIGKPKTFDVTLRDGLQNIKNVNEIMKYNLPYKKKIYHDILFSYFPSNIEVGSLVSNKVFPILEDSMDLLQYVEEYNNGIVQNTLKPNHFILVPSIMKLKEAILNPYANNFSFITSVSDSFQKKNTNMTLKEVKQEITDMIYLLDDSNKINYNVKLYISCINECPIEGKIDNDVIVHEILKYNNIKIDNICLSDTCGTLDVEDFEYIVDTCYFFGIPYSKFSLHLHVPNNRKHIVKQLIHSALDRKITMFDVSLLETGGCSVTMEHDKIMPNLSYDLYYDAIISYINKKLD